MTLLLFIMSYSSCGKNCSKVKIMKKKITLISISFILALFSMSCAKDVKKESSTDVDATTKSSEKVGVESVANGNIEFAFNLYSKLKDENGNIFLSPYSVSSALAMTYGGAKKKTASQMVAALNFPENEKSVHKGFKNLDNLMSSINSKGDVKLAVANSLWPEKTFKFLKEYVKLLKEMYGVTVSPQDFVKAAEKARLNINTWVEDNTNKKIVDLIGEGVLDDVTKLVLVNAIYFKGDWKIQFNKEHTREASFFVGESKNKVQMMSSKAKYRYAEDNSVQVIELPYKGEELSMVVVLPKVKDSLAAIESSMTYKVMQVWEKAMLSKEVNLFLPKFKIEWGTKTLDPALKELGMVEAFSPKADFSGMTGNKDLFIKTVLHKAFIEVNEEGSEAAAATAVVMARASIDGPRPIYFRADHPFLFFIKEKSTGTILFMGRVVDPK